VSHAPEPVFATGTGAGTTVAVIVLDALLAAESVNV
jgi:hypothetical protein